MEEHARAHTHTYETKLKEHRYTALQALLALLQSIVPALKATFQSMGKPWRCPWGRECTSAPLPATIASQQRQDPRQLEEVWRAFRCFQPPLPSD